LFFADVVGLSGSPPDTEVPTLSLINGYTARLDEQTELNLREAWVRTEVFSQTLAISAGRLDLTNYFTGGGSAISSRRGDRLSGTSAEFSTDSEWRPIGRPQERQRQTRARGSR
jgi:hypothetical protein